MFLCVIWSIIREILDVSNLFSSDLYEKELKGYVLRVGLSEEEKQHINNFLSASHELGKGNLGGYLSEVDRCFDDVLVKLPRDICGDGKIDRCRMESIKLKASLFVPMIIDNCLLSACQHGKGRLPVPSLS